MEDNRQIERFPLTLKMILKERRPKLLEKKDDLKDASVLIPLIKEREEIKLLFTKRTMQVENHKGQISFPGGIVEKADNTFLDTALRETEEEIGLKRDMIEILGQIDDTLTLVSNYIIHPFVGYIPFRPSLKENPHEVEEIIFVPLKWLLDERWKVTQIKWEGDYYNSIVFEYNNHIIWGATARILKNLLDIIYENRLILKFVGT